MLLLTGRSGPTGNGGRAPMPRPQRPVPNNSASPGGGSPSTAGAIRVEAATESELGVVLRGSLGRAAGTLTCGTPGCPSGEAASPRPKVGGAVPAVAR